jgi:hypothetical protein
LKKKTRKRARVSRLSVGKVTGSNPVFSTKAFSQERVFLIKSNLIINFTALLNL